MHKCRTLALVLLAAGLLLVTGANNAMAQDGPDVYRLSYFSNANTTGAPNGLVHIGHPGTQGDQAGSGDLCANIYVFTPDEQLNECCSCRLTPNALLVLSINPVTGSKG